MTYLWFLQYWSACTAALIPRGTSHLLGLINHFQLTVLQHLFWIIAWWLEVSCQKDTPRVQPQVAAILYCPAAEGCYGKSACIFLYFHISYFLLLNEPWAGEREGHCMEMARMWKENKQMSMWGSVAAGSPEIKQIQNVGYALRNDFFT